MAAALTGNLAKDRNSVGPAAFINGAGPICIEPGEFYMACIGCVHRTRCALDSTRRAIAHKTLSSSQLPAHRSRQAGKRYQSNGSNQRCIFHIVPPTALPLFGKPALTAC